MSLGKYRYRIVVDCEIEINSPTSEQAKSLFEAMQRDGALEFGNGAGPLRGLTPSTLLEDQQGLLNALLSSEGDLDRWLREEIAGELDSRGFEELQHEYRDEELLRPVIDALPTSGSVSFPV